MDMVDFGSGAGGWVMIGGITDSMVDHGSDVVDPITPGAHVGMKVGGS